MKLILTAEVDHLGSAGDTVEVKDGYGRNYLLPRGLAIAASRGAERQADEIRRAREVKTVRDLGHAGELKTAIEGLGPYAPRATAASCSVRSRRRTSSRPSRRPAARISTSGPSSCPRHTSSPSETTGSPCGCTPTSTPWCR
jgi:hypothetical protein